MLRTDTGVIETRTDAVNVCSLPVVVLQYVTVTTVQHARHSVGQRGRVLACRQPVPARFHTDEFHGFVINERVKHPRRVRAAAHARHHDIRQAADLFQ